MLEAPSIEMMVVGALGFAIQIYADFFGYTLMALGIASLLGFRLSRNFNSPYFAWSPSEFGDDGIFRCPLSSETTYTFLLAALREVPFAPLSP